MMSVRYAEFMKNAAKRIKIEEASHYRKVASGMTKAQFVRYHTGRRLTKLAMEFKRFEKVMATSDTQLRASNSNERSELNADPAYNRAVSNDLHGYKGLIEKRQLNESDYNWLVVDGTPSSRTNSFSGNPSSDAVSDILQTTNSGAFLPGKAWEAATEKKD